MSTFVVSYYLENGRRREKPCKIKLLGTEITKNWHFLQYKGREETLDFWLQEAAGKAKTAAGRPEKHDGGKGIMIFASEYRLIKDKE